MAVSSKGGLLSRKNESTSMISQAVRNAYANTPVRFIIAGGYNTAFAYVLLAVLYYSFSNKVHYIFILVFSTAVNITNAYIVHKFFVFKTKGNYIREYLRYYVIYSVPIGIGLVFFPFCIEILKMNFYVTQALLTFVTVIISYFGHKHVSFRVRPDNTSV